MLLPKILPQGNAFLREVLFIIAARYLIESHILLSVLPEMTATQVTLMDKNIYFAIILVRYVTNLRYNHQSQKVHKSVQVDNVNT